MKFFLKLLLVGVIVLIIYAYISDPYFKATVDKHLADLKTHVDDKVIPILRNIIASFEDEPSVRQPDVIPANAIQLRSEWYGERIFGTIKNLTGGEISSVYILCELRDKHLRAVRSISPITISNLGPYEQQNFSRAAVHVKARSFHCHSQVPR
jgi:hypothetical protein